jgi:hypothetical protein
MELETFDDLTRAFSGTSTRRRFSGLLTALGLGTVAGLGLLGATDTEAKRRHKKHKKHKKHKNKTQCANAGATPTAGTPCCQGLTTNQNGQCSAGTDGGEACIPDCVGPLGPKHCGSDGCGGVCGTCSLYLPICNQITFTCEPLILFP